MVRLQIDERPALRKKCVRVRWDSGMHAAFGWAGDRNCGTRDSNFDYHDCLCRSSRSVWRESPIDLRVDVEPQPVGPTDLDDYRRRDDCDKNHFAGEGCFSSPDQREDREARELPVRQDPR